MNRRPRNYLRFSLSAKIGIALTSAVSFVAFTWPLYLPENILGYSLTQDKYWIFLALVPISLLLLGLEINKGVLDIKSIALLAVLAAIAAALRQIGAGAVGIEPMWFIIILASRVFGPTFGFALGSVGTTLSALITGGIGPWLPFQIIAASWIGLLAGSLPNKLRGRIEIALLMVVALVSGMTFGFLMDLQMWPWLLGTDTSLSFIPGDSIEANLERFIAFHFLTAMAWDIPRSLLTAILIGVTGAPILGALRRTERRAFFISDISEREMARTEP